jgi:transcriptional regulator with XRE-family HTH domain
MPESISPWEDDGELPDPLHRLTRQLIAARVRANLTQEDVAWRMKTSRPAISRLEHGRGRGPSFATLVQYAEAVGCDLDVRLTRIPLPWERSG